MKQQLSIVKFLTSVKIKEETNYCRTVDFVIELEDNLVMVQDRRNGLTSYVPIHNVSYYKLLEATPITKTKKV